MEEIGRQLRKVIEGKDVVPTSDIQPIIDNIQREITERAINIQAFVEKNKKKGNDFKPNFMLHPNTLRLLGVLSFCSFF